MTLTHETVILENIETEDLKFLDDNEVLQHESITSSYATETILVGRNNAWF